MNNMNKSPEHEPAATTRDKAADDCVQQVLNYLDVSTENLPTSIQQSLVESRLQAIRRAMPETSGFSIRHNRWLVPAVATTILCALWLPTLIQKQPFQNPPPASLTETHPPPADELVDIANTTIMEIPDEEQLDLLENLAFYRWLDQHMDTLDTTQSS